jgi:RNA polymerase sigma-70 factor (ECF subfamily)
LLSWPSCRDCGVTPSIFCTTTQTPTTWCRTAWKPRWPKHTLQDSAKLRGWLFAILNNLFLMRLRSNTRRGQALSIDDLADSLAASATPDDRGLARDLGRAMGKLSVEHRQILLLLNVEGYSYQEIADTLDIPIGTVMSRLARARSRLRALLEGHDIHVVD